MKVFVHFVHLDLVVNCMARSSYNFKYLCANSVKDGWKIEGSSTRQTV